MTQQPGATGAFDSAGAARAAVARLVRAGFRRTDIDTWPRGETYLVHVRTEADDHPEAVRLLRERSEGLSGVVGSTGSPELDRWLPLGLAALAGVVLYGLLKRR